MIDKTELARKTSDVLREVAMGAVIQVVDARKGTVCCWLSADPPPAVAAVADTIPEPGTALDHIPAGSRE